MDQSARTTNPLSRAMLGLEQTTALDPLVQAAQPVMDGVVAEPAVRDALQGRWLGHALHPLVVMVPLGTWLSASLLDASPTDRDGSAASLLVAAGILGAIPSAASGWAELAQGTQQEKRVGVVHAAANVVGLGLQVASVVARRGGNRAGGALLSLAAMGAVGAAGYLGGHLAVARDLGTKDPAFEG